MDSTKINATLALLTPDVVREIKAKIDEREHGSEIEIQRWFSSTG